MEYLRFAALLSSKLKSKIRLFSLTNAKRRPKNEDVRIGEGKVKCGNSSPKRAMTKTEEGEQKKDESQEKRDGHTEMTVENQK